MDKEISKELSLTSRRLLKKCYAEIKELKHCGDCYLNGTDNVLSVCTKPHILLWVQYGIHYFIWSFSTKSAIFFFTLPCIGIYPHWPAKLLQVNDRSVGPLEVLFFNDNESGQTNYSNCYLYSKEDPTKHLTDQYTAKIATAMKVRLICYVNCAPNYHEIIFFCYF